MWLDPFKKYFSNDTSQGAKRLQHTLAGLIMAICLICSYLLVTVFFREDLKRQLITTLEASTPVSIETASSQIDLSEVWRHKIQEDNKKLGEELTQLKELFEDGRSLENKDGTLQDLKAKVSDLENRLLSQEHAAETIISNPFTGESNLHQKEENFQEGQNESQPQHTQSIYKFSLNLNGVGIRNQIKTPLNTIPGGSFARTVLLSGLDASAAMNASSDPRPMLLRIIDHGTLPRRFQSDLKDCHCLAAAYGDISSERVYARLEKLTCIRDRTGEIIETQVAGYIAGSDGKTGMRGRVASRDGEFLSRSLVGGIFSGLSSVASPQNRKSQTSPFLGNSSLSTPNMGEMFVSGVSQGTSTALDRLSQYYIERAEQLQPVIQVDAGQVVDIVFTEGATIGVESIKKNHETAHLHSQHTTSQGNQDHD